MKTPVFYWWEPDPFLSKVDAVRISFPDHSFGCDSGNNYDANTGTTACDYPKTTLQKIVSNRF